jgi:hypothetical protein
VFSLDGFDRDPVLNTAEKAAIISWQELHRFRYKDKESLNGSLLRLTAPIVAALKHANYLDEVKQRRVISRIFLAMSRTQTTYWSWPSAEWNGLIVSRPLLTCACLLHGPEILLHSRRIKHIQDLAGTILGHDGIQGSGSDLEFEDQKSDTKRLRKRLWNYTKRNVSNYPYTVSEYFYNPVKKAGKKSSKTLWETFLNEFLKGRHDTVHGDTVSNPISHEDIIDAITKIEILILVFIINVCSSANLLRALPEHI